MADPDSDDLRNIVIALFIVTFFVTSYRCCERFTKRLWWHDDSVALFSMISFIVFLVEAVFLADESTSTRVKIINSYILNVGYYLPVWGGRISIVLTVIRITPWKLQRKILLWVVVLFFLQFVVLVVQTTWVCKTTQGEWEHLPGSICVVSHSRVIPISLVVTTVISDAMLIAAPLMILRGVRDLPALRFRLFSIFSMSIATTVASVAHAILMIVEQGIWEAIFAAVEAAVSIIVCNMSVVIPAVLRVLGVGDPFMRDDTMDPSTSTIEIARAPSTTIELTLPTSWRTALTDSDESQGTIGMVTSRRGSVDLGVEDDQKHRLTTQPSDGSLGSFKSRKVVPLVDESDIADSLVQAGGSPAVRTDEGIEADARGRYPRNDGT